jgi:rSAM/selenodomain-associated transferase 2
VQESERFHSAFPASDPYNGARMHTRPPFISIIVPVLNEALLIADFLARTKRLGDSIEIIVVDGGSNDATREITAALSDKLISAPRGRASQMNAGAAIANGEIFWFLHADSTPPAEAINAIRRALSDGRNAGGCFSLRYPRPELIYRLSDSLGNIAVNLCGFALGDHGIFCRRSAFLTAGCYPDVPILEDAELYRALHRLGRMVQLRENIATDPRTFEKSGRYRTTAVYLLILALYVLGVPIRSLNQIYRRFHRVTSPLRERNGEDDRLLPRAGALSGGGNCL